MKIKLLLLSLIVLSSIKVKAQFEHSSCGTNHISSNSEIQSNSVAQNLLSDDTIIIPVVFHVLHRGGNENVSSNQIKDALRILNEDFQRLNADTIETPLPFQSIAGKLNMVFRLASIDPEGNCTEGIIRYFVPATAGAPSSPSQNSEQWPKDKYFNIYITKNLSAGAVSGTWNLFGGTSGGGNINLTYFHTGSIEEGIFDGRTITHEAGHWLSLNHVWGDTNNPTPTNGCASDDGIDDTPLQAAATFSCPSFPLISCNNDPLGDNYSNYMDYTECRNMFTQEQIDVMIDHFSSHPQKSNLCTEENLIETGTLTPTDTNFCDSAPIADFCIDRGETYICLPNNAFQFFDRSWKSTPTSWTWTFDGGIPATSNAQNPSIQFTASGNKLVQLIVSNDFGQDTIEREIYIHLFEDAPTYSPTLVENFEEENSFDGFYPINLGAGYLMWERTQVSSSATDDYSIYMNLFQDSIRGWKGFLTPKFDLSNVGQNSKLKFDVAFAKRDTVIGDTIYSGEPELEIYATINCGANFYFIGLIDGDSLATSTPIFSTGFTPNINQWKSLELDMPNEVIGRNDVQFWIAVRKNTTFGFSTFVRGIANNLYIDNIEVIGDGSVSTSKLVDESIFKIYPIPTSNNIILEFNKPINNLANLQLFDSMGRLVKKESFSSILSTININFLPNGIYFVKIQIGNEIYSKKIIIEK